MSEWWTLITTIETYGPAFAWGFGVGLGMGVACTLVVMRAIR